MAVVEWRDISPQAPTKSRSPFKHSVEPSIGGSDRPPPVQSYFYCKSKKTTKKLVQCNTVQIEAPGPLYALFGD